MVSQPITLQRILVAGATGGVGQLVVAKLLSEAYTVRVLTRQKDQAEQLFESRTEVVVGDIRQPETLPAATQNVDAIICCTGTTAFPSLRWEFKGPDSGNPFTQFAFWSRIYFDPSYRQQHSQNNPEAVDAQGVTNLVQAAPSTLKRFVFVSSCGVDRKQTFPFNILNAFGVLDAKSQGETAIRCSGLPYTIVRPARLIDGPFTSYDLNTLLKTSTGGQRAVVLGTGDRLVGQSSRIDVAAACVACLEDKQTENVTFELINQGVRPAAVDWSALFAAYL